MDSTSRKITQSERAELLARFNSYKPVSTILPMVFPSGYRLTKLAVSCPGCQQLITSDHFRCHLVALLPRVYRVDGIGICQKCRISKNYMFRLRDADKFLIEQINEQGQWTQYASKRVSRFHRFLRSATKLLRTLL